MAGFQNSRSGAVQRRLRQVGRPDCFGSAHCPGIYLLCMNMKYSDSIVFFMKNFETRVMIAATAFVSPAGASRWKCTTGTGMEGEETAFIFNQIDPRGIVEVARSRPFRCLLRLNMKRIDATLFTGLESCAGNLKSNKCGAKEASGNPRSRFSSTFDKTFLDAPSRALTINVA